MTVPPFAWRLRERLRGNPARISARVYTVACVLIWAHIPATAFQPGERNLLAADQLATLLGCRKLRAPSALERTRASRLK